MLEPLLPLCQILLVVLPLGHCLLLQALHSSFQLGKV